MKKIISLVIASAAVAMALFSCTKEISTNKEEEKGINADGTRTLTVSFATKATKTYLLEDGITPVWKEGDQISLNGTSYTVPTSAVGKSTCTITTDIQGDIIAVYPADAYQSTDPYFKVKDKQDGSFGCANICVAKADAGVNTLTFENKTAVFAVAVPDGTSKLTVTSLGKIDATTGQRGKTAADTVAICTTEEGNAAKVITVEKSDKSEFKDTVYVAVAVDPDNGVLLADLNFDTGKSQGGVSPNYIKSKGQEPLEYKAAAGTIYTPVLHEYVTVDGKKCATMNIGATSETDYGDYFAWGETTGHVANTSTNKFENDYSFSWTNAPFNGENTDYDATTFNGYKNTVCPNGILALAYDAAFCNWGGAWRMPTKEEFDAITKTKSGWNSGYTFGSGSDTFFLPAAGEGVETTFNSASFGYYWTSSLRTEDQKSSGCLQFWSVYTYTTNDERCTGMSVRALSE